jgi:peptidyl-prolyl cis-trans isomerase D
MLDIMRKKKQMTAFVLWAIIIALGLSMLVWGINIGGSSGSTGPGSYAAIVDDHPITVQEFKDNFEQSIRMLQEQTPEGLDPKILKSLGLSQQVLDRLIRGKIVEILADRWNLSVSPNEVRQAIINYPQLQVNGRFVGLEQYKALLSRNRIRLESFEDDIRYDLLSAKLSRLITDSLEISDEDLKEEFIKRNQSTKVAYVVLKKDNFKNRVKPTEEELQSYFDSHKDAYTVKEKRRAEYLLIPTSKILPDIKVSEQEIEDEWAKNPAPETVEAAHILFLVKNPSEKAQVQSKAESVLEQIRKGGDFAALARKYSEDPGSAEQGGYLGTFPRGQMVKEFEDAAFSLKPGEVSGLVYTPDYGFHIIKVLRHDIPTMESNRSSLVTAIRLRKAKDVAKKKAEEAARLAVNTRDLDAVSKQMDSGAEIKETGLFSKDDNPYSLGISQALRDDIFKIEEVGSLGNVVEHALGFAVAKLQEVQKARPGELEEFREQAREDLIGSRAQELMLAEANKISGEAKKIGSLEKAAKELGYAAKISQDFKSDESPGEDIQDRAAFNFVAFRLDQGSVSEPITMSDTAAVLEVKSRSPFDEAAFEQGKEALRDQIYQSLQGAYLEAYFRSFREELEEAGKIRVNPDVFDMVENFSL